MSIHHNTLVDLVGVRFLPSFSASAIRIGRRNIFTDITPVVSGRVHVHDNVVDGFDAVYPNGLAILNTEDRVVVRDNNVYGVTAGIRIEGEVKRPVRITGNHVVLVENPQLDELFPGTLRFGITGQGSLASTPSNFLVRDNLVESEVADFVIGISMFPINAVGFPEYAFTSSRIVDNVVILGGEVPAEPQLRYGMDIFSGSARVSDVVMARNNISGVATRAFVFEGFEDPAVGPTVYENNRVVDNEIGHLVVLQAAMFFDPFTRENLYRGAVGDVVLDQGVDNTVVLRP